MIRGLVLAAVFAATVGCVGCKGNKQYPPCEDQSCCEVRRSTYLDECSEEQDEVYSCGHAAKDVYQECLEALE